MLKREAGPKSMEAYTHRRTCIRYPRKTFWEKRFGKEYAYYYCVISIREDSTDNEAASGRGGLRSGVAVWRWIEDYAVLFLRAAPRGV
jgi:hypothetical protein